MDTINCCSDLLRAAYKKCFACVKKYADDPEQQNLTDSRGRSALFDVLNHHEILKYLLQRMFSKINDKDNYGITLLCECMFGHQHETAKILIQYGADINSTIISGEPILNYTILRGKLSMVKFLIDHGADVNIPDKNLDYPLHQAICRDVEYIELLLAHGAKYEKNIFNQNVIFRAIEQSYKSGVKDKFSVVKYLIGHPYFESDLYACGTFGRTILHSAVINNDYPIFKLIPLNIVHMFINKGDDDGKTPLHLAVEYDLEFKICKKLLKYGASLDARDALGRLPIDYAINDYRNEFSRSLRPQNRIDILKLLSEWQDLPS